MELIWIPRISVTFEFFLPTSTLVQYSWLYELSSLNLVGVEGVFK